MGVDVKRLIDPSFTQVFFNATRWLVGWLLVDSRMRFYLMKGVNVGFKV